MDARRRRFRPASRRKPRCAVPARGEARAIRIWSRRQRRQLGGGARLRVASRLAPPAMHRSFASRRFPHPVVLAVGVRARARHPTRAWPCRARPQALGLAVRRDGAHLRCAVGDGGGPALREPRPRYWYGGRGGADARPPLELGSGRAFHALSHHHRSAAVAGGIDRYPLAGRGAPKRLASFRRGSAGGFALRRRPGTLPASPADTRACALSLGMVG